MEWTEQIRTTHPQKPMGKYMAKFPMCRKVITDTGHVWAYDFNASGIIWRYECCILFEINKNK